MAEMVTVIPGLIALYRRSHSARWQARIKIEGEWIRRSTGSADLEEARENALDIPTESKLKLTKQRKTESKALTQ